MAWSVWGARRVEIAAEYLGKDSLGYRRVPARMLYAALRILCLFPFRLLLSSQLLLVCATAFAASEAWKQQDQTGVVLWALPALARWHALASRGCDNAQKHTLCRQSAYLQAERS